MRFFNTAGPVNCKKHYCLPPLERFDLEEILYLIEQEKYFVLHAPRQTGKTSCLLALMSYLNSRGRHRCLYVNVESAQAERENIKEGMRVILGELASRARAHLKDSFLEDIWLNVLNQRGSLALNEILTQWAEQSPLPSVLLIDEIDSLIGDTLISVLRQLRSGYDKRPGLFPRSIILCGVRDVRDYRIRSGREKSIITGGSAFNVKAESLRLGDFSGEEVRMLCSCHTEDTGQIFAPGATDMIWELSEGQPWLVNALGYEACFEMRENRDRSVPVTSETVHQAKENLIYRRDTHLDQLADKLAEDRVRRVIAPILAGEGYPEDIAEDDLGYVRDLGLIKIEGNVRIANPIYQEVIPRSLTYGTQVTITHESVWYVREEDGMLDMDRLLAAFQDFFRRHSESWEERFRYKEAGPQLLMQAFLQRILNRGGRIHREYGLGRKRTDLLLVWPCGEGKAQEVVIELKIRRGDTEKVIGKGLKQTWQYMDRCGTDHGHLIIFDRRKSITPEKKIFRREETYQGHRITVWGM